MSVDIDALQFYSGYPIDKIVDTGTVTITNDGDTGTQYQQAKITTDTLPNPYGKQCFVRFVWSIDNQNYNASTAHLVYTFDVTEPGPFTATIYGLQAAVSIGTDNNNITILTGNGYHGDVDDTGAHAVYTPISQTFTIKYVLFTLT